MPGSRTGVKYQIIWCREAGVLPAECRARLELLPGQSCSWRAGPLPEEADGLRSRRDAAEAALQVEGWGVRIQRGDSTGGQQWAQPADLRATGCTLSRSAGLELPAPSSSREHKGHRVSKSFSLLEHGSEDNSFETEIIQVCYIRTKPKSFENNYFS